MLDVFFCNTAHYTLFHIVLRRQQCVLRSSKCHLRCNHKIKDHLTAWYQTARLIDSTDEGSSSEDTYQFERVRSSVSRDAARGPAVDDSREFSTALNAEAQDTQFNPGSVDIGQMVNLREAAQYITDHLKETWSTPIQRQSRGTMGGGAYWAGRARARTGPPYPGPAHFFA